MASTIKVDNILDSQGNAFDGSQLSNVGKVLQVQYMNYSTQFSSTSTSYYDSGLTLTITPKKSDSRFLIQWIQHAYFDVGFSSHWEGYSSRITRNDTAIWTESYDNANSTYYDHIMKKSADMYMDTPNISGPIIYKIQHKNYSADAQIYNYGGSRSSLVIYEIGA